MKCYGNALFLGESAQEKKLTQQISSGAVPAVSHVSDVDSFLKGGNAEGNKAQLDETSSGLSDTPKMRTIQEIIAERQNGEAIHHDNTSDDESPKAAPIDVSNYGKQAPRATDVVVDQGFNDDDSDSGLSLPDFGPQDTAVNTRDEPEERYSYPLPTSSYPRETTNVDAQSASSVSGFSVDLGDVQCNSTTTPTK
ncbi:hypothetical protein CYMTET_3911, partial [Cymbomonas tetramitiformis]